MNPQSNENLGFQLPTPVTEQLSDNQINGESSPAAPEQKISQPAPPATNMSQQQPTTVPISPPAQQTQPSTTTTDVSNATNSTSTLMADDNDLIEKEWVSKAKQIVDRNRDDPYKQSEELTGVKVDYMKKRYNKTIKLS